MKPECTFLCLVTEVTEFADDDSLDPALKHKGRPNDSSQLVSALMCIAVVRKRQHKSATASEICQMHGGSLLRVHAVALADSVLHRVLISRTILTAYYTSIFRHRILHRLTPDLSFTQLRCLLPPKCRTSPCLRCCGNVRTSRDIRACKGESPTHGTGPGPLRARCSLVCGGEGI